MSPLDIIRTAIYSLTANRLRAALALLGIVLGVCSVITLMSIGRGSTDRITELIQGLGSNLLTVVPTEQPLTLNDVDALRDPLYTPSIKAVAPQIGTFGTIHINNNTTQASISGITPEYLNVRNLDMATGTFIGAPHVEARSEVVVLGAQVSEDLFGNQDPTGAEVRINGRRFRVVGVLASQSGFGSVDNEALIPITTAYYRLSGRRIPGGDISVDQISIQVRDVELVDQAIEEIETVIRLSHRITEADDFTVFNQQEILDTFDEANQTLVVFLGAHPRNRNPTSNGRQTSRHRRTIRHRSRIPNLRRRNHRHHRRNLPRNRNRRTLPHRHRVVHPRHQRHPHPRHDRIDRCWSLLRHLPSRQSRTP